MVDSAKSPFSAETTRMMTHARRILEAGIQAVDAGEAVRRHCIRRGRTLVIDGRTYPLDEYRRVLLVGVGKASAHMAQALEEILGDRVEEGLVCVKYGHGTATRRTQVLEAGHPVPDENGMRCASGILELAGRAGKHDLVLCAISGGGSALAPVPAEGLSLMDKQEVTSTLLACGATIHEINAIRKHISRFKGGNLARAVYPATLITLLLSDVVGDDLDVIASGPTAPDSSTYRDCLALLDRYEIGDRVPSSVVRHLERGVRGEAAETPKYGDPVLERTRNVVVGCNLEALRAAGKEAERLGYRPLILSSRIQGETREVARALAAVAQESSYSGMPLPAPACLLSGGETTVTLKGDGTGGRNTEFALAAGMALEAWKPILAVSVGTDGTDGPTDAAGAMCCGETLERARAQGLDPLRFLTENDSYTFFRRAGGLIVTGPTHTNVMDLRFFLVAPPEPLGRAEEIRPAR